MAFIDFVRDNAGVIGLTIAVVLVILLLYSASSQPLWVMSNNIPKGTTCVQMCSREGRAPYMSEHMTGYANGTPTDDVLFWVAQGY